MWLQATAFHCVDTSRHPARPRPALPHEHRSPPTMRSTFHSRYVLYLAVVPFYRQHCIDALTEILGDDVKILTGADNIDPTVTTGIAPHQYTPVTNRFVLK